MHIHLDKTFYGGPWAEAVARLSVRNAVFHKGRLVYGAAAAAGAAVPKAV
ncbi:hypothetical protein QTI17_02870 [Variovorax sp. J31P179]|nr:hypothetical protein [Variovorax sp. J31P179]